MLPTNRNNLENHSEALVLTKDTGVGKGFPGSKMQRNQISTYNKQRILFWHVLQRDLLAVHHCALLGKETGAWEFYGSCHVLGVILH